MWGEVLVVVVGSIAVAAVVRWGVTRSRPREGGVTPPSEPASGGWVAAAPLDATFPVERTPHERAVGDAAFVDGFIVGRYVTAHEHTAAQDRRPAGPAHAEPAGGGDDPFPGDLDDPDDPIAYDEVDPYGPVDPDDPEEEDDAGDGLGFGFDAGFEEDDW